LNKREKDEDSLCESEVSEFSVVYCLDEDMECIMDFYVVSNLFNAAVLHFFTVEVLIL
jgi:hypothetical protein